MYPRDSTKTLRPVKRRKGTEGSIELALWTGRETETRLRVIGRDADASTRRCLPLCGPTSPSRSFHSGCERLLSCRKIERSMTQSAISRVCVTGQTRCTHSASRRLTKLADQPSVPLRQARTYRRNRESERLSRKYRPIIAYREDIRARGKRGSRLLPSIAVEPRDFADRRDRTDHPRGNPVCVGRSRRTQRSRRRRCPSVITRPV